MTIHNKIYEYFKNIIFKKYKIIDFYDKNDFKIFSYVDYITLNYDIEINNIDKNYENIHLFILELEKNYKITIIKYFQQNLNIVSVQMIITNSFVRKFKIEQLL